MEDHVTRPATSGCPQASGSGPPRLGWNLGRLTVDTGLMGSSRPLHRRTVLVQSLLAAGAISIQVSESQAASGLQVENVTRLYPVEVARVVTPRSTVEVKAALASWPGEVAVGGGRYSMGGQVAVRGGLHVDMRQLNALVWLQPEDRAVRVQAGMRWRDLQDLLDPHGLAVKIMQSYSNFTVGGSVSVNCHGRYVGLGPVGHSIRALQLVTAAGDVVEVGPQSRPELFSAAVGGYGAVGIITEVELDVVPNVRIQRRVTPVPLRDYAEHFRQFVLTDPTAVLHNADLLPPDFAAPVCVTWHRVGDDVALTEPERLVPKGQSYALEQSAIFVMTELPGGARLRERVVHPLLMRPQVVKWLNHEASLDVAELEPRTRAMSTYVLPELCAGDGPAAASTERRGPERVDPPFPKGPGLHTPVGAGRRVFVRLVLQAANLETRGR